MISRLISILLLSCPFFGWAQSADALLWNSVSIDSKLTKDFNAELDLQFRFDDNMSRLASYFGQLAIDYELTKHLKITPGYRLSNARKFDNYFKKQRLYVDLNYDEKIVKRLNAKFRIRTQHDFNRLRIINENTLPDRRTLVRFRYGLQYKYKDWRPSLSNEWFFNTNSRTFDGYRVNLGLKYKISKRHGLKFEYTFQSELLHPFVNEHIYQISYRYNLKGKLFD